MTNKFEYVGRFWNDKSLEVYKIEGEYYVLDGWTGEVYSSCYKLEDNLVDVVDENKMYSIRPIYNFEEEDIEDEEIKVVDYAIY